MNNLTNGRAKTNTTNNIKENESAESKRLALHYMRTLVDVAREPFLILDATLKVISGNPMFYQVFRVSPKQTENKVLYELGNGQWNIPELKRLIEGILPDKKIVKNFLVKHVFQTIGERTILLNARQIDTVQLIILAMEDISERKILEEKLADYTKNLEIKIEQQTANLHARVQELESLNETMVGREIKMVELKKEISSMKQRLNHYNGGNGKAKNGSSTDKVKNGNHNHNRSK